MYSFGQARLSQPSSLQTAIKPFAEDALTVGTLESPYAVLAF